MAHAFGVDARDEKQMSALFDRVESTIAPLGVMVFNVGPMCISPSQKPARASTEKYGKWLHLPALLAAREAARLMQPSSEGTMLFTGATASVRGGAGFAAFASAKFALRALAQSLVRELCPLHH